MSSQQSRGVSPKAGSPAPEAAAARARRLSSRGAVVLVLLTVVLFSPTWLTRDFTDAPDSILRLSLVSHAKHVPEIFSRDFTGFTGGRYRPLPYAVLAVARTFVRPESAVFWHGWLLAFHVLNSLIIYGLAAHFARRVEGALAALALFALHPSASALANQIDLFPLVLTGTLYLGSLLCYLRYARRSGVPLYGLSLALFLGGLFSSHVVMTLPLLLLLYELLYERTPVRKVVLRLVPFAAALLVAGGFYWTFRPHPGFFVYPPRAVPEVWRYWLFSFAVGGLDTVLGLLRGVSAPVPVSASLMGVDSLWLQITIASVLLLCVLFSLWRFRRKAWFAVGVFLLVLGRLPRFGMPENLTPDLAAWSYTCLPLAGLALLVGALVDVAWGSGRVLLRRLVTAAAAAGVLVLAGLLLNANLHARSAESWWGHVLRQNPHSQEAALGLGRIYLVQGREKDALCVLFPRHMDRVRESCLVMARHYARRGDLDAAAVHLLIAAREECYGLSNCDLSMVQAEILQEARAYDFAEQQLGLVLMVDPCNTTALRRLAEVLAIKGYVPGAFECLQAAADIDPGDPETLRLLQTLRTRLYQPEISDVAMKVDPPHPEWLRYVTDQGGKQYMDEALPELADVYRTDPIIQMVAGISMSETGKHDPAFAKIERAIEMLPRYARARAAKCWAAANAGKRELALSVVDEVTHVRPWDRAIWHQIGYNLLSLGKQDVAFACLGVALRADPDMAELQNDFGAVLSMQGRHEEALPHFERALELPGGNRAAIHNGTAIVLMHLEREEEALAHFRKAVELDPWYQRAYLGIVRYYTSKGRFAEAVRVLSEGVDATPGDLVLPMELSILLAAAPREEVRDGKRAVRLAEAVCRKADPLTPEYLDILAAAYAECGLFDVAARTAAQGVALARVRQQHALARTIQQRSRLYEQHRPYRLPDPSRGEPPPAPAP